MKDQILTTGFRVANVIPSTDKGATVVLTPLTTRPTAIDPTAWATAQAPIVLVVDNADVTQYQAGAELYFAFTPNINVLQHALHAPTAGGGDFGRSQR